jgi:hypothetical protein
MLCEIMSDKQVGINIRAAITAFVFTLLLASLVGGFVTYTIAGILIAALHISIDYLGVCMLLVFFGMFGVFFWFVYQITKAFLAKD